MGDENSKVDGPDHPLPLKGRRTLMGVVIKIEDEEQTRGDPRGAHANLVSGDPFLLNEIIPGDKKHGA